MSSDNRLAFLKRMLDGIDGMQGDDGMEATADASVVPVEVLTGRAS